MDQEICRFLIDAADAESIVPLLHEDGNVIRLYRYRPTPGIYWCKASVPLAEGGPNRSVLIQSLEYDLEIARNEFVKWIGDFRHSGMTLVQSSQPLPYDLHPRRFRDPVGFEMVLKRCGAVLLFELPHSNETAGVTVFSNRHAYWIGQQGVCLREDG